MPRRHGGRVGVTARAGRGRVPRANAAPAYGKPRRAGDIRRWDLGQERCGRARMAFVLLTAAIFVWGSRSEIILICYWCREYGTWSFEHGPRNTAVRSGDIGKSTCPLVEPRRLDHRFQRRGLARTHVKGAIRQPLSSHARGSARLGSGAAGGPTARLHIDHSVGHGGDVASSRRKKPDRLLDRKLPRLCRSAPHLGIVILCGGCAADTARRTAGFSRPRECCSDVRCRPRRTGAWTGVSPALAVPSPGGSLPPPAACCHWRQGSPGHGRPTR